MAVWAAAVNSKCSVKEKAWRVNLASGLVLHETGIEAHPHLVRPLCASPTLHVGQDLSGPELLGIRQEDEGGEKRGSDPQGAPAAVSQMPERDLGCVQEGRSQPGARKEGGGNSATSLRPPNLLTLSSRRRRSELDGQMYCQARVT